MARQMIDLLDEYIPVVAGSEVNDDPLKPLSKYARDLIAEEGDNTPIHGCTRSERYGEKLATPDVSVADLIGDIDPIKAANLKLEFCRRNSNSLWNYSPQQPGHFCYKRIAGSAGKNTGCIIQYFAGRRYTNHVDLNCECHLIFCLYLQQILKIIPIAEVIVTPLKDSIESQILTHYPKTLKLPWKLPNRKQMCLPEQ